MQEHRKVPYVGNDIQWLIHTWDFCMHQCSKTSQKLIARMIQGLTTHHNSTIRKHSVSIKTILLSFQSCLAVCPLAILLIVTRSKRVTYWIQPNRFSTFQWWTHDTRTTRPVPAASRSAPSVILTFPDPRYALSRIQRATADGKRSTKRYNASASCRVDSNKLHRLPSLVCLALIYLWSYSDMPR